jgi:bifunctional NMN adenylyltransferase/nudix hydrolase
MTRIGLLIGRFQPPTNEDIDMIRKASDLYDYTLVLVAGAHRPARVKAPMSWEIIAKTMIDKAPECDFQVMGLLDTLYDNATWVSHVRLCLDTYCDAFNIQNPDITLLGQTEDNARKTLSFFPDWSTDMPRNSNRDVALHTLYAQGLTFTDAGTRTKLLQARSLLEEEQTRLQKASEVLGYPVILNTSDAVVVQSNHLLVVQRPDGLYSIPGVHITEHETGLEAALRAARTKGAINMPKGALEGRLTDSKVFDHPDRSERGRVRTEAFLFTLPASGRMEDIKGKNSFWLPFNSCYPHMFFEDHYDIAQALLRGISCIQPLLIKG